MWFLREDCQKLKALALDFVFVFATRKQNRRDVALAQVTKMIQDLTTGVLAVSYLSYRLSFLILTCDL